jgi:transketolase
VTTTTMLAQRDVWADVLIELAAVYPRLVVLDGDGASSTRADRFEAAYPDRFFQMGIAEQNMAGVAAGLATLGFAPWISALAIFQAKRMLDQVRLVVAQPKLSVRLAAHYSGILTNRCGKSHVSVQDIAIMRAMPNMTVIVPADGIELRKAMYAVMEHDGPVYLRLTRDKSSLVFGEDYDFEIGKAAVTREGGDVTIISTGVQTTRAMQAASDLASEGIQAHVLHVPTLKPIDKEAIVTAAEKSNLVLTTEEHTVVGGLGAAVAEVLGQERPTLMKIHGLDDVNIESGPNEGLLEQYRISPQWIALEAKTLLARAGV